jgi:hypothetical protein
MPSVRDLDGLADAAELVRLAPGQITFASTPART